MPSSAVVGVLLLCIIWLFARDRKLRPMARTLWVPLVWVCIIGSRSVSLWSGERIDPDAASAVYLEGSPLDRNIFLFLIIAGVFILRKRGVDWAKLFSSNRCLFAYFIYYGVSIIWSDFPFVSFKQWIKDLGNVIMVLILLTESDAVGAVRAVLARYVYLAIPVSAALILSFPDIGSYYTLSTNEFLYCGVTTSKNELGQILVVSGLFLVWDLIEKYPGRKRDMLDMLARVMLLAMVMWMIVIANSSTSVGSLALGTMLIIFMQFSPMRNQIRYLGMYSMVLVMLILFINIPIVLETLVGILGRDMTFTGRTDIWYNLLKEPINPLVGTGFRSFWIAPGTMERYGYINQAHNGYLETYLNGGWLGLFFLTALIISVGMKVKKELLEKAPLGTLLFTFLMVNLFVNITEAMLDKLNPIWFLFLLASLEYRAEKGEVAGAAEDPVVLTPRQRLLRDRAAAIRCSNGR